MNNDAEINRLVNTLPIGIPHGDPRYLDRYNFNATISDRSSWLAAWRTFAKFGYRARAYHVTKYPGWYSVELFFDGIEEVLSFYRKQPNTLQEPSFDPPVPAGFKGYIRITPQMTSWEECPMVPWSDTFDLTEATRALEGLAESVPLMGRNHAFVRDWQGAIPTQPRNHLASLTLNLDVHGPVLLCFS